MPEPWRVQDGSEAGAAGNGTIVTTAPFTFANIAFDAGNDFRFGVLRLTPAYGSEQQRQSRPDAAHGGKRLRADVQQRRWCRKCCQRGESAVAARQVERRRSLRPGKLRSAPPTP